MKYKECDNKMDKEFDIIMTLKKRKQKNFDSVFQYKRKKVRKNIVLKNVQKSQTRIILPYLSN